jgi:Glycosyltransferase sugar-binding region containing DXD motif
MIHILYLMDKTFFENKMSRVRFHGINALAKRPDVSLKLWGPGWDGYNRDLPLSENLTGAGVQKPDIIFVYKAKNIIGLKDVPIPKAVRFNEMYDVEGTIQEIVDADATFVVCHHENDYKYFVSLKEDGGRIKGVTFVSVSHCAEKTIFNTVGAEPVCDRKYDIVISGAINGHYPLRSRIYNLIPKLEAKFKVYYHKHPGYTLTDAHTDKYLIELADVYKQGKICVTCSGLPRSRFGKYVEIPACGAIIAGDLPGEERENIEKFTLQLSVDMTDDEIIAKFSELLADRDKMKRMSADAVRWASEYTQEHYGERLYGELWQFLKSPLPLVNMMWYSNGECLLSNNEIMSIKSFLRVGHPVRLWIYHPVGNLPVSDLLLVEDGNQIVREEDVFKYRDQDSYSAFSNIFRYRLLYKYGGYWADMDMVCLKAFDFKQPYVFACEAKGHPASCVIRTPKGADIMGMCLQESVALTCTEEGRRELKWGTIGPKLLKSAIGKFELGKYKMSEGTFCPFSYKATVGDPNSSILNITKFPYKFSKEVYAVHLWNEIWRREGLDKDGKYEDGCLYEQLKNLIISGNEKVKLSTQDNQTVKRV